VLDDEEIFVNIGQYYGSSNNDDTTDESDETDEGMEQEDDNDVDPEVENVQYWKETNEERIVRLDISRMILNGVSVELIKKCTRLTTKKRKR
jgi:hypothetical protein